MEPASLIASTGKNNYRSTAPFRKTLGRDTFAHSWLADVELPSDPRNRFSLLVQRHDLIVEGEASLA
jgi:hypothetical protein